jgi:hypothetical protein
MMKTKKKRRTTKPGLYTLPLLALILALAACETGTNSGGIVEKDDPGSDTNRSNTEAVGDASGDTTSGNGTKTTGGESSGANSGGNSSGGGTDGNSSAQADAVSGASVSPSQEGGETAGGETGNASGGGQTGGGSAPITAITVPDTELVPGGFGTALNAIKTKPAGAYRVELAVSGTRTPYNLTGFNTPVTILIDGKGNYLSLEGGYNGKGSLLTIQAGVTVILKDVALKGCDTNTKAIVTVENGGSLIMKDGAEISGARRSPVDGGAVRVNGGGFFQMDGGSIRDNTGIANGGAVFIAGGEFIMTGGTITDNQASNCGGVFMYNGGSFVMTGGSIAGNTSKNYAGGVLVNGGKFEMQGGFITDNICHLYGGGVFVGYYSHLSGGSGGVFVQKGGTISGNRSAGGGGGVSLRGSSAVFVLKGGAVSGNLAVPDGAIDPYGGGGVFVQDGGIFVCESGSITNNVTQYELWGGGGILVQAKDAAGTSAGGVDAVSGASGGGGSSGGGGTTYRPGLTLSGGIISGNSAGNHLGSAIYAGNGDFTLSGSPAIDGRVCLEYQPAAAQHILIDGSFTGSTVPLDLRGDEKGITFIGNWMRPVLKMAGGGAIPASVRSRFALGKFTPYSGSPSADLSAYAIGETGLLVY